MSPEELDELVNEYFIMTFMDIYGLVDLSNHTTYHNIVKTLTKKDKKFQNIVNDVNSFVNSSKNKFPPEIIKKALIRNLVKKGVDEDILVRAENTFNREELHNNDSVTEANEEDWMIIWQNSKNKKNFDYLKAKENESFSDYLHRIRDEYNKGQI